MLAFCKKVGFGIRMNRWGVIACIFSLSVGCIVGYAAHESTLRFDHALEVDDLKSEIELQEEVARRLQRICQSRDRTSELIPIAPRPAVEFRLFSVLDR
jgi:hypothetical protein